MKTECRQSRYFKWTVVNSSICSQRSRTSEHAQKFGVGRSASNNNQQLRARIRGENRAGGAALIGQWQRRRIVCGAPYSAYRTAGTGSSSCHTVNSSNQRHCKRCGTLVVLPTSHTNARRQPASGFSKATKILTLRQIPFHQVFCDCSTVLKMNGKSSDRKRLHRVHHDQHT